MRDDMPEIVSVVVLGGRDEGTVLGLIASLMSAADDPLGSAILNGSTDSDLKVRRAAWFRTVAGKGVTGSVDNHDLVVGSSSFLLDHGLSLGDFDAWHLRADQQGQTTIFAAVDGELAAFLSVLKRQPVVFGGRREYP
jgi:P-type Cu+ transporter